MSDAGSGLNPTPAAWQPPRSFRDIMVLNALVLTGSPRRDGNPGSRPATTYPLREDLVGSGQVQDTECKWILYFKKEEKFFLIRNILVKPELLCYYK